jgi:hypothetical protein
MNAAAQLDSGHGLTSDVISADPVRAWLRTQHIHQKRPRRRVSFFFDSAEVVVQSRSARVIAYLADQIARHHPSVELESGQNPGCIFEIHVSDSAVKDAVSAFSGGDLCLPQPHGRTESGQFIHLQWTGAECFLRPSDLFVSLTLQTPPLVDIIIVRAPSWRSSHPFRNRRKTIRPLPESRLAHKGSYQNESSIDLADVVKIMTIRAGGHFCLHAAAVASGDRGALLMGPSGCGKTTTALALLRDGFELLSDELSVLKESAGHAYITGFRCEPRFVGRPPDTLAGLEQTLTSKNKTKIPWFLPYDLAPVKETRWLKPAALFFLRIEPGAIEHRIDRIMQEEAYIRITDQILDPTNVFRQASQAQAVISLVQECPAYELIMGRNLTSLSRAVHAVMEDAH